MWLWFALVAASPKALHLEVQSLRDRVSASHKYALAAIATLQHEAESGEKALRSIRRFTDDATPCTDQEALKMEHGQLLDLKKKVLEMQKHFEEVAAAVKKQSELAKSAQQLSSEATARALASIKVAETKLTNNLGETKTKLQDYMTKAQEIHTAAADAKATAQEATTFAAEAMSLAQPAQQRAKDLEGKFFALRSQFPTIMDKLKGVEATSVQAITTAQNAAKAATTASAPVQFLEKSTETDLWRHPMTSKGVVPIRDMERKAAHSSKVRPHPDAHIHVAAHDSVEARAGASTTKHVADDAYLGHRGNHAERIVKQGKDKELHRNQAVHIEKQGAEKEQKNHADNIEKQGKQEDLRTNKAGNAHAEKGKNDLSHNMEGQHKAQKQSAVAAEAQRETKKGIANKRESSATNSAAKEESARMPPQARGVVPQTAENAVSWWSSLTARFLGMFSAPSTTVSHKATRPPVKQNWLKTSRAVSHEGNHVVDISDNFADLMHQDDETIALERARDTSDALHSRVDLGDDVPEIDNEGYPLVHVHDAFAALEKMDEHVNTLLLRPDVSADDYAALRNVQDESMEKMERVA